MLKLPVSTSLLSCKLFLSSNGGSPDLMIILPNVCSNVTGTCVTILFLNLSHKKAFLP